MDMAHQLAKRARGRGPLARLAARQLLRAGDRGDRAATNMVWALWLRDPRDELWAALSRWQRPKSGFDAGLSRVALGQPAEAAHVVKAARWTGHPIAATARATILAGNQDLVDAVCEAALTDEVLTAFCVEHHLAPADPHRAAVFFLMTGQDEQYRLVDPDHSLLALAYQGTTEEERTRIRARAAGEPEIVRVLADTVRRGRLARLGKREAEYLTDLFVRRRDWTGLWQLTKELPVIDAAAAVHRFDGWRPDGPDAALFDTLAAADPAELAASHAAAATPVTVTVPVKATNVGAISPDGQRIAVRGSVEVNLFAIPRGAPPQHLERWPMPHHGRVLALDGDVLIVSSWERDQPADCFTAHGYRGPGGPRTSGTTKFYKPSGLVRTADGFATVVNKREQSLELHLLSGQGWEFAKYTRRVIDLLALFDLPARVTHESWHLAVEPESRLVALAGDRLRLARLTDDGLQPLATVPDHTGTIAFSGPNRLVGMSDKKLRVWRLEGDELHVVAERKIAGANPIDLPRAGVIVMQDMSVLKAGHRRLRYVDRETLVDVPAEGRFNRPEDTYGLFGSPDGAWFGVCYWGSVEVVEVGFTELVHRPLAATTPPDLHTVHDRLGQKWLDPATRPFLELLYACLVHRFGTDVALGKTVRPVGQPDDIALGGTA